MSTILESPAESLNPYFTGLSILITKISKEAKKIIGSLNPYFTGLSILIGLKEEEVVLAEQSLNPYFTGLSILIGNNYENNEIFRRRSQSLFYWIIYSYISKLMKKHKEKKLGLNPYFTGLSILISGNRSFATICFSGLNPYFTGLSILIILGGKNYEK